MLKRCRNPLELLVPGELKPRADKLLRDWGNEQGYSPCHACEWTNDGYVYTLDNEALADQLYLFLGEGHGQADH